LSEDLSKVSARLNLQNNAAVFDRIEKLIAFPVVFPLKVMGVQTEGFAEQIADCVIAHLPSFDPSGIEVRLSSKGTYQSLTLMLPLKSRLDLEAVYNAVSAHPLVKFVL
jgi:uncharacterized protein